MNTEDLSKETVQTTQTQVMPKRKYRLLPILSCLVLMLGFLGVIGLLSAISAYRGTNKGLASLNKYIPTEKIPLIKNFGKSDEELVKDSLIVTGMNFAEQTNESKEVSQKINVLVDGTADNQKINADITFYSNSYTSKDQKNVDFKSGVTGKVKAGVMSVDLEEGVKLDILSKDNNAFVKLQLPSALIDNISAFSGAQSNEGSPINSFVEKYNGQFIKIPTEDFLNSLNDNEETLSPKEIEDILTKKFEDKNPELMRIYNETIGNVENYATVENKGRVTIAGKSGSEFDIEIDRNKFTDSVNKFVEEARVFLKDNKSRVVEVCLEMDKNMKKENCETQTDGMIKNLEELKSEDVKKVVDMVFDNVNIDDLVIVVSLDDNSILKSTIKLSLTEAGRKNFGEEVNSISVSYEYEIVSIGEEKEITLPTDAKNFEDLKTDFQKLMEGFFSGMMTPTIMPENIPNPMMDDSMNDLQFDQEQIDLICESDLYKDLGASAVEDCKKLYTETIKS